MAQKVIYTDDIDGSEGAATHRLVLDDQAVEIDLSDKNFEKLSKVLKPYIEAGRRPSTGVATVRKTAKGKSDPAQLKAMREWLRKQGKDVSDRGRIPAELQAEYHAAHVRS